MTADIDIREATIDDHEVVEEMTAETWRERPEGDYLGRVFPDWIEPGDLPKRTLVADYEGRAVAIAQGLLLSPYEGWGQGLRVHPDFRGRGLSTALARSLFDWAADRGATVFRAMVFAWNAAGLGQARAVGYEPACAFRWVHVTPSEEPRAERAVTEAGTGDSVESIRVSDEVNAAWSAYRSSDAARALDGLALSMDESWAVAELTRGTLERARDEERLIAVHTTDGVEGMSVRCRVFESGGGDDEATYAEYGVATWTTLKVGAAVLDAIAEDAASIGADRTRVLVPETPRHVSDAAVLRAELAEYADFVMAADLGGTTNPVDR